MAKDSLEDDRGHVFSETRLVPLTPELRSAATRRSYVDAHLLVVFGIITTAMYVFGPKIAHPRLYSRYSWGSVGIACLAGGAFRYLYNFFVQRAKEDRRRLLKRGLCPVCLKPLDKYGVHGETIACDCGATWERRYM